MNDGFINEFSKVKLPIDLSKKNYSKVQLPIFKKKTLQTNLSMDFMTI